MSEARLERVVRHPARSHLRSVPDVAPGPGGKPTGLPRGRAWPKRGLDVGLGVVAVVLLAPVMVVIALLVRCSGPGPVLFRQVRVGVDGRPFVLRKFRTMHTGAERALPALRHLDETGAGPLFKMRDDPRVTRVGHWLRRLSLDELPQLFNVLGGSMSLVGPRPALPEEAARYSDVERRRLLVKPGLTGLWQVSGRSDLPWVDGVGLDLHYVEHASLRLDLTILARTLPAVLAGRGAY